jgi:hypothetical protein
MTGEGRAGVGQNPIMGDDPEGPDLLGARLAAIEAELAATTGGASLCVVSKRGEAVDGAKYLEGRMAAVLEVRRSVRRGDDLADRAATALVDWRGELDAARRRGLGGGWIAYRTGGVDELTDLVAAGSST